MLHEKLSTETSLKVCWWHEKGVDIIGYIHHCFLIMGRNKVFSTDFILVVEESCRKECGDWDGKMNGFCERGAARVSVGMLVSLALFCMQGGAFRSFQ